MEEPVFPFQRRQNLSAGAIDEMAHIAPFTQYVLAESGCVEDEY